MFVGVFLSNLCHRFGGWSFVYLVMSFMAKGGVEPRKEDSKMRRGARSFEDFLRIIPVDPQIGYCNHPRLVTVVVLFFLHHYSHRASK